MRFARLMSVAVLAGTPAFSQTLPTASTAPAPAPVIAVPASAPAPAPAAPVETKPFVGVIAATRVYVRSGPGQNYYELGQLTKGDTVEVMGQKDSWYIITPPTGVFCYIAKELVDVDSAGTGGTVKGEYVNVRAGSALHPASDYAVVTVVKKGTPLVLLGSTDKYYKISPPEKAVVYVSSSFVKPAPSSAVFTPPALKLPAGVPALGKDNIAVAPGSPSVESATTGPATTGPSAPPEPITVNIEPPSNATQPAATTEPTVVTVVPQPAVTFNTDAYATFNSLNEKTQAEFMKPLLQRDLSGLLAGYKSLLGQNNLPPSVQQSSAARVDSLEKMIKVQESAKSAQGDITSIQEQSKAIDEQFQATEQRMADAERAAPYLAEGILKTSSAVANKYVLVNPTTGRVTAYLDPASDVDISKLLNEYVGVKGKPVHSEELGIDVIKVKTITMLKAPE